MYPTAMGWGAGLVLAASTVQTVGGVIAVLAVAGIAIYLFVNLRAGHDEIGSELELAPNRKPYLDDEELEGPKLTKTLGYGVVLLGISAVGLPLYWLAEPGRQEGAIEEFDRVFVSRGQEQYEVGSQCVNCHAAEGRGGQAPYTVLDGNGDFVANVNWLAPALDTVLLRFDEEEVTRIINRGRPGTPMPAWGAEGGGPRSDQQIRDLVAYLDSIQRPWEEAQRDAQVQLAIELGLLEESQREDDAAADAAIAQIDYDDLATGEAAFNMGKSPIFAGGAYSCARCHTTGWSIITDGDDAVRPEDADLDPFVEFAEGAGAFAPPLSDLVPRQFASVDQLAEFITIGNQDGVLYGRSGNGDGMMPGYGDNPNTADVPDDGMLPREIICAIARYESTLRAGEGSSGEVPPSTTTTSTTTTTPAGEEAEAEEEPAEPEPAFCDLDAEGGEDSEADEE